ncbi:HAAS domain-containing protein [Megasphaera cerevisiae]|nr:DUF1700 domain-containing protein [Megasphaera cerevisiae]SJZ49353.1 Protein of unknown function [Megasphaera cerevisiae DSM 20462]
MRKIEFMDLLKYYFRKSDKEDLKGILEDCEEQFRLGAKEGRTEEDVCRKLGHPKNIYRYYIGKPIVPEDNASLAAAADCQPSYKPQNAAPYDWEKDPERRRRREQSESYYHQPDDYRYQQPQASSHPYREDAETGRDFKWDTDSSVPKAAKAVASPFLDILGTLFGILSGFLYLGVAAAVIACIAIANLPAFLYTDLLPLPTLSLTTMVFTVLAILFAALTTSYAGQACHDASRGTGTRSSGRNS